MYLILVGTEVWQTPKIVIDENNDTQTLFNFYDYKNITLNANSFSHDNACLFLVANFKSKALGIAQMDSMCNSVSSGSFISDNYKKGFSVSTSAAVITHEIGHNLGLIRDENLLYCPCGDVTGKCIMSKSLNVARPSSTFSSCSKEYLVDKRSLGLDLCLFNVPNLMSINNEGSPICGNGVIEQGEDCDCGGLPSDICNNACCGADCKFISPATCAIGMCCDVQKCNIKLPNTICRASDNPCDLPELCDGISAFCPTDIYKHDGTMCVAAGSGYHVPVIVVSASTVDDDQFTLDLRLNRVLLSAEYQEKVCTDHGDYYLTFNKTTDFCFYIGNVRGFKESTASLSTCDNIRGFFVAGGNSYSITPLEGGSFSEVIVEKEEDTNFTCGVLHSLPSIVQRINKRSIGDKVDRTTRFIELYAVSDTTHVSQFTSSKEATQRIKEVVNAANALYNTVDMYLILVGTEVWQTSKIIIDANNATQTLYNFYDYKNKTINANSPSHDNACLFLVENFPGRVIGIARLESMCNSVISGSLISDNYKQGYSISTSASLMTHEIGHNLGLIHDDDLFYCPCGDVTGTCIMSSSLDVARPSSTFSSCSKEYLVDKRSLGLDLCLFNVPNLMSTNNGGSPICGNGVIEQGEDCDCGGLPSDICNRACCRANCKLVSPATCAMGMCCDVQKCNIKLPNTICRASDNPCDLPELCDGISAFCPTDIYKHDGTSCNVAGNLAYCSKGKCQNHESQCQKIWLSYASASPDYCYARFNVLGNSLGSCKINLNPVTTFLPCDIKDVKCGQLFCETYFIETKLRSINAWYLSNFNPTCASAFFDFGKQILTPGFVPNGAVCGNSKTCVDQKCVDVASVLSTNPCPSSCSICDNSGQCRCENGFPYPNCNGETFTEVLPTTITTTATMPTPRPITSTTVKVTTQTAIVSTLTMATQRPFTTTAVKVTTQTAILSTMPTPRPLTSTTVNATTQTAIPPTTTLDLNNLSNQILLSNWITFLSLLLNAFGAFIVSQ